MKSFFSSLGELFVYAAVVARRVFSRRYSWGSLVHQMHRIGVESLTVVNLCAFFIGLVLVVQTQSMLKRFGAETQVSKVVTASFVREIGPVFAAIMFTGRSGTGIAAELGSMVVTEQIDAYRVFGVDPVARLAVPRILATVLMLPALTVIANVVGIFSGFLIVVFGLHESGTMYLRNASEILAPLDIVCCIVKGLVFGFTIGLVATHIGFKTERATEAVGTSTTRTMVQGVLAILIVDLVITKGFLLLGEAGA
ncbi:MAG: ABC transporter permease [Planctomycetes bacterium]|nr:ABC transporter permease [Planctomycetota bacterium]